MTIEERIAMSDQLEQGQAAEGQGLRAAARGEEPVLPYSSDLYLQNRFLQGLQDGRVILRVRAVEGQPSPYSAGAPPHVA